MGTVFRESNFTNPISCFALFNVIEYRRIQCLPLNFLFYLSPCTDMYFSRVYIINLCCARTIQTTIHRKKEEAAEISTYYIYGIYYSIQLLVQCRSIVLDPVCAQKLNMCTLNSKHAFSISLIRRLQRILKPCNKIDVNYMTRF